MLFRSELFLRRVAARPDLGCFVNPKHAPTPGTVLEGDAVAVRDGSIKLLEVQLPGGKVLPIEQFIRGNKLEAGDRLEKISDV